MATVANLAFLRPAIDKPLSKPNRQYAGSPVGVLTAAYSGEIVLDLTTGQLWCGAADGGTTNWTPVFLSE